ncbi:Hemolysin-3 like protein [Tritrichomonas foetus]|uniref:Hemolysin-3 like protein n=1 Tax=Tritrichomonas foetus TaxID=1144522 RepID=A0A1J4JCK8_9EUKA|nr:Hemolysin-3 like protein [Tritrichomonas foetus]|eukprot:OHS95149.1 Hemolysin-3 like protein [Tritrichomonas foetus]
MSMKSMPIWQEGEEFMNSLTHGVGAGLSLFATYFLIQSGIQSKNNYKLFGNIIFGLSMILLYSASMLYHGAPDSDFKKTMRYIDHCSVFILIAGSYTPFTLTVLKGKGGYPILAFVWMIALFGIFSKIFFFDAIDKYTVYLYIAMGWVIIVSLKNLVKSISKQGLFWLVLGGVTYTIGTYFYTNDQTKYYHAIFHLFILGGTLCHFICALLFC